MAKRSLAPRVAVMPEGAGEVLPCGCVRHISKCWEAQLMWLLIVQWTEMGKAESEECKYLHSRFKEHLGI